MEREKFVYMDIVNYIRNRLKTVDPCLISQKRAYQVDIAGEGRGTFYVKIADGLIAVEPYDYRGYNARFVLSAGDLLDLVEKKQSALQLVQDEKVKIEGDWASIMELNGLLESLEAGQR